MRQSLANYYAKSLKHCMLSSLSFCSRKNERKTMMLGVGSGAVTPRA